MLATLSEARTVCSRFVESGTCDLTTVDARINEAIARLCDLEPWAVMLRPIQIRVCNACFALPYQVEKLERVAFDGTPGVIWGPVYQFLSSGPGDLDFRVSGSGIQQLLDLGDHWPTFYDVPRTIETATSSTALAGAYLCAFATTSDDVGKELTVEGFDDSAHEVTLTLPIKQWSGGVEGAIKGGWKVGGILSETAVSEVSRVRKPVTTGYCTLLAVDPATNYIFVLAKYHPRETLPQFRRYRIVNKTVSTSTRVRGLARLRALPVSDASDVLLLDSIPAIKLMVIAIREENAGNLAGASQYLEQARAALGQRQEAAGPLAGSPHVLDVASTTGLGRHLNRRGLIL
jgi:hypothetical protein